MIEEDILPGFASAISVIALFNPIEKISSIFSILADLFSHFKYGPKRPEFKVISWPFSGCWPRTFGREHKYLALSKAKAAAQAQLAEPKLIGKHENGNDIYLKNGRFGPYLQYEKIPTEIEIEKATKKKKKSKKNKSEVNELLKNVSIPKGLELESIDLEKAKFLCSLPKSLGINPDNQKEITLNTGRFGPYLKCENKSARIENIEEIFSIGLNRAITLIAEAKPGRMSSSMIKDLGEHPEDKKPVRIMKGQYGPYIKYKSLNATIPEEKDPTELTMEEALILIEKRKEYDKTKKKKKKWKKNFYL